MVHIATWIGQIQPVASPKSPFPGRNSQRNPITVDTRVATDMVRPVIGQDGNPAAAIAFMLAGAVSFGVMDGLTKMVVDTVPVPFILWMRYAVVVALLLAVRPAWTWTCLRRVTQPTILALRGLMPVMSSAAGILALAHMTVADVTALMFTTPLVATALSLPLLGERVGRVRWCAVLMGFGGVLLVAQPGSSASAYALLALLAALILALYQILTRTLRGSFDANSMLVYMLVTGLLATSAIVPFFWDRPTQFELSIIAGSGVLYALAHLCVTRAFTLVEAARVTPFAYVQIVAASGFAYLAYSEIPNLLGLAGTAVIMGSGIAIWFFEQSTRN